MATNNLGEKMRYDGNGGIIFDENERVNVAQELLSRAEQAGRTSNTYSNIGYNGHAHMAQLQAETLGKAAGRVMSGQSVAEYEMRPYEG